MAERGYSGSHQVAVDVAQFGGGKDVSARWCEQDTSTAGHRDLYVPSFS